MKKIPENKQWRQTNRGDALGNIYTPLNGNLVGTFNCDFYTNAGKVRGTRMIKNTVTSDNISMVDFPVGFKEFNDGGGIKVYTVAGVKVHVSTNAFPSGTFTADVTSGTPTDCSSTLSDIEVFNGALYVTGNSKLYKRTTGNWSSVAIASGGPWMMCPYGDRLYYTVSGLSRIYSTADGTTIPTIGDQYTLQLPTEFRPTFIEASSNRIWIGTQSTIYGKAYIYEWDGSANEATRFYRIEATGALSCTIKDDIPYVMDSNGRELMYTNGTFKEVARLPVDNSFLYNNTSTTNNRFIHPNGMAVINSRINILINNRINDNAGSIKEFCPSGIWEYDENIGLTHKASFSYIPVSQTGITDYGQNRVSAVGGLSEVRANDTTANTEGNLLAGANIYTDATNTTSGVFLDNTLTLGNQTYNAIQRAAYFVTTKIESQQITDIWQSLFLKYRKLYSASDLIVVKYRLTEGEPLVYPLEATITWTSTTTFTTTTDISSFWTSGTGGEMEVLAGTGSGICSHITNIVNNAGTYTVTVDVIHTGVTNGTAKARFQNWIKIGSISDTTSYWKNFNFPLNATSTWVQIKVFFMESGGGEIEEINLQNITSQGTK